MMLYRMFPWFIVVFVIFLNSLEAIVNPNKYQDCMAEAQTACSNMGTSLSKSACTQSYYQHHCL